MGILDKPDDIPQDVWDVAWDLVCDAEAEKVPYYAMSDEITVARKLDTLYIARALMAAKAEEREACALVAEAETLTGTPPAWADPMQIAVVAGTVTATAKSIAAAIRERGEVNTAHKNSVEA